MTYDKHCLHLSRKGRGKLKKAGKPFVIPSEQPDRGKTTFTMRFMGIFP